MFIFIQFQMFFFFIIIIIEKLYWTANVFSFDREWLAVQCTTSQWRWPSAIFFCWVVYTSVSANYSRLVWTCSSLLTGMRSLTFFISFFSSLYLCWNVICHTILYEMMNEEFHIEFACEEFNISTCTFYSFGQTFLFFFSTITWWSLPSVDMKCGFCTV